MKRVQIKAPVGTGVKMAELAFELGIPQVSISEGRNNTEKNQMLLDVLKFKTDSKHSKEFIKRLKLSPFYDPMTFSYSTGQPESKFPDEEPGPL